MAQLDDALRTAQSTDELKRALAASKRHLLNVGGFAAGYLDELDREDFIDAINEAELLAFNALRVSQALKDIARANQDF